MNELPPPQNQVIYDDRLMRLRVLPPSTGLAEVWLDEMVYPEKYNKSRRGNGAVMQGNFGSRESL